ncbi:MAG: type III-B CRISPR module-associated protein Cmr3 [Candidatus Hydrothermales bacterium]
MIKFTLEPFDVLFFGSGKPFNMNVQETDSIFPPFPNTLASSICGKIFSERNINVKEIIEKFYGPFLEKNNELLLPKPLDILIEKKVKDGKINQVILKNKFKLINPSHTDGNLKSLLWEMKKNGDFETFEGFIKLNGLKKWLDNEEINENDIIHKKDILDFEPRIGIKMDYSKNVTEDEDALYRINYVRLKKEVKIIFFIKFNLQNEELKKSQLNDEQKIFEFFKNSKNKVLKLGGEMRNVRYECEEKNFEDVLDFNKPDLENDDIIKILYLTPGFFNNENFYETLTGAIKIINIGMHTKNYGIKTKKSIKEGSVIYAKVKDKTKLQNIWLNPKDKDFIGSNLRIYTKTLIGR